MPNPRRLTEQEVEALETLIAGAEDQSLIQDHVDALAAYKNNAATEEQLDLLEGLLDPMYEVGLFDHAVQKAFDEAEVPPLPPATDKPEDT